MPIGWRTKTASVFRAWSDYRLTLKSASCLFLGNLVYLLPKHKHPSSYKRKKQNNNFKNKSFQLIKIMLTEPLLSELSKQRLIDDWLINFVIITWHLLSGMYSQKSKLNLQGTIWAPFFRDTGMDCGKCQRKEIRMYHKNRNLTNSSN